MLRVAPAIAVAAISILFVGPAAAQTRVKAGTLSCDVSGGFGVIVASHKTMRCVFVPYAGRPERYAGVINRYGLDVGGTTGRRLVWSVYAPSGSGRGALAGDYAGASGEATVGVGVGANVLVGGSNSTVALQPLSLQGQRGLNLALGVAGLRLSPAR